MGTTRNDDGADTSTGRSSNSVLYIWGTLADTTWRIFVPTVGGTLLGAWGDAMFASKPWLMVAGITAGIVSAIFLVRLQLKKTK